MAEASNGEKLSPIVKESPNGAAGPMSTDGSMTATDEMSIHLSPRGSLQSDSITPRTAKVLRKPSATASTRPRLPTGQTYATASTPKPRPQSKTAGNAQRSARGRAQGNAQGNSQGRAKDASVKRVAEAHRQKCDMCEEMRPMSSRCLNCQLSMCASCLAHHRKMKICSDHELQDWDNARQNAQCKAQHASVKRVAESHKQKCDMCEEVRHMNSRCLNCQLSMCASCLAHHRKMKFCSDHELQDWDKFLLDTSPPKPPPISSVPDAKQACKTHKSEKLQFYCKVCLQPLCIACKLTKHEGHKTRDLFEEINEQRDTIPMKIGQLKASFLPLMKQQLKELEDYDDQFAYNVKGTLENIEKRTRIVKDEVDRTSRKLVERLRNKEEKENTRISNRRKALSNYVRMAQTSIASAERIIRSGDDFEVMELYQNLLQLLKKMQDITKQKPGKTKYIFQDGQLDQGQLQLMFGNYTERGPKVVLPSATTSRKSKLSKMSASSVPVLELVPEIHARLLTSFQCKSVQGNKISAIAPLNDQEAWLCFGWTSNEIYLYNKDGYRKNRLVFKHPVDDLALDHDGNLLVSIFTGNIVRLVDRTMQVRDFFQCPLRCRGITVANAGHIIVCGVDMCTAQPPPLKCTIFKFTAKGNKTGHLDGDKTKRVPIHPYRVTENIDGSLAVADWVNDKEGRVVVFSHDGKVRMVYYGYSNETRNFLPYGIASDKFGHILVGDIINHEVHLLDIKGHFLRVLLTREDLAGERPYSLAVDNMGMLWVGNERAQVKIFRYLLNHSHIVSQEFSSHLSPRSNWVERRTHGSPRSPSVTPRMPLQLVPVDVITRWQMDMKARLKHRYKSPPNWKWT